MGSNILKKEIYSPSDCDKSISINWYYSIPQDFEQSTYTHCTEIYFLGKLFEHLIQDYNLAYLFKYGEIVEQMTKPKQTDRIESFMPFNVVSLMTMPC